MRVVFFLLFTRGGLLSIDTRLMMPCREQDHRAVATSVPRVVADARRRERFAASLSAGGFPNRFSVLPHTHILGSTKDRGEASSADSGELPGTVSTCRAFPASRKKSLAAAKSSALCPLEEPFCRRVRALPED